MVDMTQVNNALNTVNDVLTVLRNVASMPGVNMLPYANTAAGAIQLLQLAIQAGQNITPYVSAIKDTFGSSKDPNIPTEAQLAELDNKIAQYRAELHAGLPPKDEDEPE